MTAAPAPAPRASAVCTAAEVSDEALALVIDGEPGSKALVARFTDAGLLADAVKFLAHALPKRESVWWAWVCARKAAGGTPAPRISTALAATERWVVQPNEENRRAAMAAAEQAEFGTPAGCAALAAFLSMGSVAPPHVQAVPPGEFASAKAVAGAVTLSAVAEPKQAEAKFREFIGLGLEVAERTKLWVA